MSEFIKQLDEGGLCNRCGLCCVVPPTATFSKKGVVCEHLMLEGEVARCGIYGQWPLECRNFYCDYPTMVKRFELMMFGVMSSCSPTIYYRENDEDYIETEEAGKVLQEVIRLGLQKHSPAISVLIRERQITESSSLDEIRSKIGMMRTSI